MVTGRYKNGVEVKIEYKYPVSQEIFHFRESALGEQGQFYYSRDIDYETSHYGIRGVYTPGNNYFIIDHLPQTGLPATISLATSWNMPKNSKQLWGAGWQQFVFEGTTPDPFTSTYRARSRIQLAVAGSTGVETIRRAFQLRHSNKDTLATLHVTFENGFTEHQLMAAQLRTCDAGTTLPGITSQGQNDSLITNGLIWSLEFSDNSRELLVYNPDNTTQTIEGITSDATVWILRADNSGNWTDARLFHASVAPTFSPPLPTPTVTFTGGTAGLEVQYDAVF